MTKQEYKNKRHLERLFKNPVIRLQKFSELTKSLLFLSAFQSIVIVATIDKKEIKAEKIANTWIDFANNIVRLWSMNPENNIGIKSVKDVYIKSMISILNEIKIKKEA